MKKKILYGLPFFLKIVVLLCCWQVSYWAAADVIYTAEFEKSVTEDYDTMLVISYPLDENKKIKITSVHLIVQEEISGVEPRSIKLLTSPKSIGKVVGDGHKKEIVCDLKKQPPIPEGLYSVKIEYEELLNKKERKKKDSEPPKKIPLPSFGGINFLQQLITPLGHTEINQIKVAQSEKKIPTSQKVTQFVPLVISLLSLGYAGTQYGHAIDAARQNNEDLRNKHLKKSYSALGVAGGSYVIDFVWVGIRNRKQKKARRKSLLISQSKLSHKK